MSRVEVQSEPLTGNRRYIILNTVDKHYLVDTSVPAIWIQLFPFLVWIIKHKCYEITPKQWNELSGPLTSQNQQWSTSETFAYTAAAIFILPPRLIVKYFDIFNMNNQLLEYIVFILGVIGVVIIRYYVIHRKKLDSSYFDENKMVYGKINYSFNDGIRSFFKFVVTFTVAMVAITMGLSDVRGSVLITFVSFVSIYLYSMINEELWKWKEAYLEIDD